MENKHEANEVKDPAEDYKPELTEKGEEQLPPDGAVEATEFDTTTHPEDDDPTQFAGDFVDDETQEDNG